MVYKTKYNTQINFFLFNKSLFSNYSICFVMLLKLTSCKVTFHNKVDVIILLGLLPAFFGKTKKLKKKITH